MHVLCSYGRDEHFAKLHVRGRQANRGFFARHCRVACLPAASLPAAALTETAAAMLIAGGGGKKATVAAPPLPSLCMTMRPTPSAKQCTLLLARTCVVVFFARTSACVINMYRYVKKIEG